jgi:adenine-specific DNA glycosylase
LGAEICVERQPRCAMCPLKKTCQYCQDHVQPGRPRS